jgi:hypothetical protein
MYHFGMKVIKKDDNKDYRTVTLRIENKIMDHVDDVAKKSKVSRQALIAAILKQVMNDPKFVLKLED